MVNKSDDGSELDAGLPPEAAQQSDDADAGKTPEIGGIEGPEPTRYGDWEKNGRCIDF